MSKLKLLFALLKETFDEWNNDHAQRLAAALSYYTIFSIGPFLIVIIAIAGAVLGQEAVQGRLDEQIQGLIGREGADLIQELIINVRKPSDNIIATVVGVVTLMMGAAGVFGQLKDALNTVWGVEPKPGGGIVDNIKGRFLSFSMVLGVGFLLLVSLVLSALLSLFQTHFLSFLPATDIVLQLVNFILSFGVITILFAMIFKVLPDVEIQWRDVWIGAAVTSLLFTIGKTALGLYLGNSGVASTYGAAGSIVLILLWVFYSSQILLFGAEFTQVYARKYGSRIRPDENAVPIGVNNELQKNVEKGAGIVVVPDMAQPALEVEKDEPISETEYKETESLPDEGQGSWIRTPITIGITLIGFLAGLFLGRQTDEQDG